MIEQIFGAIREFLARFVLTPDEKRRMHRAKAVGAAQDAFDTVDTLIRQIETVHPVTGRVYTAMFRPWVDQYRKHQTVFKRYDQ